MRINQVLSFKKWRNRFLRYRDILEGVDFVTGVESETLGLDPSTAFRSTPSGNGYLRDVLKHLNIKTVDRILDIGCGKGSAMRVMLKFPFEYVHGIELSPQIAAIAQNNFKALNAPKLKVHVFVGDASSFKELDKYTHFYFYNPFSAPIMQKVLANILASIQSAPRKIRIIYNNPVCHAEILSSKAFQQNGDFPDEWGNRIFIYESI
jgi:SAM-dependent methyltransferase